jgi:hypothetical protein
VWISCHKESTVGFPQLKPLPKSTANSGANNFTGIFGPDGQKVGFLWRERESILFCFVKPIECKDLLVQILEFSSVVYTDFWIVLGQADKLYDTFGREKVLDRETVRICSVTGRL